MSAMSDAVKVEFHTPYRSNGEGRHEVEWPEGWPVPRKGDGVCTRDGDFLSVRTVVWYPHGEEGSEPFAYVVLGGQDD